MSSPFENLIEFCERERHALVREIEMFKSGRMRTSENHGQGLVDTTTQSLDRAQSNLAEIERILAEAEDQL
jgi:hypothetical protein